MSFLNLTGQVGLVLYMFLVGLEVDPRLLRGRGRQILALIGTLSVAPLMIGVACAGPFGGHTWRAPGVDRTAFALFLGAAIATVALPVIAHLIQEKGLLDAPVACLGLVVGSAVTVVAFVAVGVAGELGGAGNGHLAARLGWMATLIAASVGIIRPTLGWMLARVDTSGNSSAALVGLLALSLAAGAAADWVGVAPLVGGLLVGLATPASPALKVAIVNRMKGAVLLVFMPVFFASSGLRTDLRLLENRLLPGVLLFVALIVVAKWAPAYLVARATGLAAREANALGALLGSGGMLALAMGAIGIEEGIITPQMQVVVVLGALITLIPIGPLMEGLRPPARPPMDESR